MLHFCIKPVGGRERKTERQRGSTRWIWCLGGELPSQGAGPDVSLCHWGKGKNLQLGASDAPGSRRLGIAEWVALEEVGGFREWHCEMISDRAGVREHGAADASQAMYL